MQSLHPIVDTLVAGLRELLTGADEDLQRYGHAIAMDMVALSVAPYNEEDRSKFLSELIAQLETLAATHKLRVEKFAARSTWAVVSALVQTAFAYLAHGMTMAMGQLPPVPKPPRTEP